MADIPTTGAPVNGRTQKVSITPEGGTEIVLNCTEEVPIAPAMNGPSVEVQTFQGGDYTSFTQDGGYQEDTVTAEYTKTNYDTLDQARADGKTCTVKLGENGFTGTAVVTVSTGPTITAGGKRIATMTVQIAWTSSKSPTAGA